MLFRSGLGGQQVAELRLLMTTSFPTRERSKVGEIEFIYTDGSTAGDDLIYGRNIYAFTENRSGENTRLTWQGTTEAGTTISLWDVAWENPHPGKAVKAVRITSAGTEASPALFAMTGIAP